MTIDHGNCTIGSLLFIFRSYIFRNKNVILTKTNGIEFQKGQEYSTCTWTHFILANHFYIARPYIIYFIKFNFSQWSLMVFHFDTHFWPMTYFSIELKKNIQTTKILICQSIFVIWIWAISGSFNWLWCHLCAHLHISKTNCLNFFILKNPNILALNV